jgi:Ca-activated chloride channel family protein
MRAALLLGAAALAAAGSAAVEGAQGFGRLAQRLGAARLAAPLMADPHLKGLALMDMGRWTAAEDALRRAGAAATYNRGAALALAGRLGDAVNAYEAVIARDPTDAQARDNRAVVFALMEHPEGEILMGVEAAGDGAGEDVISPFDEAVAADGAATPLTEQPRSPLPQTIALGREEVLRMPDARGVAPNMEWVQGFPDDPGLYLRAIIAAEHARRLEQNRAAPEAADPW